jgi:hypothetical protein
MSQNYKIHVYFETPDGKRLAAVYQVEAFVAERADWQRYDVCRDATSALVYGGVTDERAARIDVEREKLAREISDQLTEHILKGLKSRDLRNGYAQV